MAAPFLCPRYSLRDFGLVCDLPLGQACGDSCEASFPTFGYTLGKK